MHVIVKILLLEMIALIYFLPAMVAISRHHLNTLSIFLTNLTLGVTGIGWIIALIWACTNINGAGSAPIHGAGSAPINSAGVVTGAAPSGFMVKMFKFLLALVIVTALLVVGARMLGEKPLAVSAPESLPPVQQGVPVPADELFGQ